MQSTSAGTPFKLGSNYLELIQAGEPLRIEDSDIQGVTTRLIRTQNLFKTSSQRRTVEIEFRDQEDKPRRGMIEGHVSEDRNDELLDYARRIAPSAAHNSLRELAANDVVERNGFSINDQAIMLTANGETLRCGLFELKTIEFAGDGMLVWIDDEAQATAIICEDDPNSLTLAQLLPRLIAADDDAELPRLIGHIECGFRGHNPMHIMLLSLAMIVGFAVAMIRAQGINGPHLPVMLGLIPVILPLVGFVAWRSNRDRPVLAMFRHGLCIEQQKQLSNINWCDIESTHLTDRMVNIGSSKRSHFVRMYTLHLDAKTDHGFERKLKLDWLEQNAQEWCTNFLRDKVRELSEARLDTGTPS